MRPSGGASSSVGELPLQWDTAFGGSPLGGGGMGGGGMGGMRATPMAGGTLPRNAATRLSGDGEGSEEEHERVATPFRLSLSRGSTAGSRGSTGLGTVTPPRSGDASAGAPPRTSGRSRPNTQSTIVELPEGDDDDAYAVPSAQRSAEILVIHEGDSEQAAAAAADAEQAAADADAADTPRLPPLPAPPGAWQYSNSPFAKALPTAPLYQDLSYSSSPRQRRGNLSPKRLV